MNRLWPRVAAYGWLPLGVIEMPGCVYFIRCPSNGLTKIGWTENSLAVRFGMIRSMSPVPLELVGYIAAQPVYEKRLHVRFADDWSHGEWFRETEALRRFIAAEVTPWTEPVGDGNKRVSFGPIAPVLEEKLGGAISRNESDDLRRWASKSCLWLNGHNRTVQEWAVLRGIPLADMKEFCELLHEHGRYMPDILKQLVADEPCGNDPLGKRRKKPVA